jgi:hypothetical protein
MAIRGWGPFIVKKKLCLGLSGVVISAFAAHLSVFEVMVPGTRRTQCCLLLLVGALGSNFSLRSQDVPFEPQARYSSAPVGGPKTLLEYPAQAVRFPITPGPNAFLNFSPAAANGPRDECRGRFISSARWQPPKSILFPVQSAVPSPASGHAEVRQSEERQVSWKLIVPNFLSDQKHIWLFPVHVMK